MAKQDRGWTVYRRKGEGALCIAFRVARGEWKNRRIPRQEASTERQAERWAAANVERLRAGEPTKPKIDAPPSCGCATWKIFPRDPGQARAPAGDYQAG